MNQTATPEQAATPHNAKRSAALFSVLAAFGVTLLKLLTGLLTGSLGMLSEAAHSGIDLIAAGITLFSVQVSDRPADADHTYGHGKIESLSAAIESVLMLGSCVWILTEAIRRIAHREHLALKFSIWPFLALLLSITGCSDTTAGTGVTVYNQLTTAATIVVTAASCSRTTDLALMPRGRVTVTCAGMYQSVASLDCQQTEQSLRIVQQ